MPLLAKTYSRIKMVPFQFMPSGILQPQRRVKVPPQGQKVLPQVKMSEEGMGTTSWNFTKEVCVLIQRECFWKGSGMRLILSHRGQRKNSFKSGGTRAVFRHVRSDEH